MWRPTRTSGVVQWTYKDDANYGPLQTGYSQKQAPGDLADKVYLPNETFGWIDKYVFAA